MNILTKNEALDLQRTRGRCIYELGVYEATTLIINGFVSVIELAAVKISDDEQGAVWVARDEACDCVDFIDADEAAQTIKEFA